MGGTVETQGVVSDRRVHGCCGCMEPTKLTCASATKCFLKTGLLLTFILGMKKILEEFFCRLMTEKTCEEIEDQGGYVVILGLRNNLRYCQERKRNICFGVNCKFGMTCLNQDFHSSKTDDDDYASADDDDGDDYYDDDSDDFNPLSTTQDVFDNRTLLERTKIKFQTNPNYYFVLQDLTPGFNFNLSFGTRELANLEFHGRFLPELDNISIHLDSKEPIYSTLSNHSHNNQNIEIGLGFNQFENSDLDENFIKGSHSTWNSTSVYSCPAPCHCPEDSDVITDKFSLEDDVVCENKCTIDSEQDPMEPCIEGPLSRDFNSSSPIKEKKKHFVVRDTELDRLLRISKKSLKISKQVGISLVDYITKRPEMIRSIVKQIIPILKTQKTLDSKFVKDNLAPLRLYGSHMSKPVETQVNFLEARPHPHTVNGLPWKYLNDERFRLMSFVKFPRSSPLSTIKLASKGFAYLDLGSNGAILCFFCSAQIEVPNNEDHIDEEHRRLGVNCPMVKDARCNNISMESQRPRMTAGDIFSQLYAYRNNEREVTQPSASAPARTSKNQTADSDSDNVRSSQPSDESTAYVIVTNTSDLAESDALLQNGGHNVQSSQDIDDSRSPRDQQGQLSVIASSQNSGSADVSSTGDNNNDAVQTSSEVEGTTGQESNTQQEQSNEGQNSTDDNGGDAHSYEKLGIITARPKRLEYAVYETRLRSFAEWPNDSHMEPEVLAKAGHYYTGYSDCARCFFCGGGMRNWEPEDSVWVEHARWFPKCAYLLQEVGKDFVATVQQMSREIAEIRYDDVIHRMQDSAVPTPLKFELRTIARDPAVLTVIDNGFDENKIFELALEFRNIGEILSSDKLYEVAINRKIPKSDVNNLGSDSISIRGNQKRDEETIKTLRNENTALRQQTTCKICMDNEVSVVFLPCRHLVSCTDCSFTLSDCPVCRDAIKGTVRAYI